ncbi:MAG: histidinol dehydrogenase [Deltaproteobacteria bacterium]|nr:histidinol dehydrogenase [Deltaproteobacteria bacterium]
MRIIRIEKKDLDAKINGLRSKDSQNELKLRASVNKIVDDVKRNGDRALFRYTRKFDEFEPSEKNVMVSSEEIERAKRVVSNEIKSYLRIAAKRIREYQKNKLPREKTFTDSLGNRLGWIIRPIQRVGIYIPGGKASYPSTVLMTAIPARVAGVEEITLVTPCPKGEINPEVLFAASIAGVDSIFKVGGAQAIAALAYGTESIPKVDKVVGPGNIYVTIAKRLVFGEVDIDMIAGPSEVLIISDGFLPAEWVAADLLAQAEHDELAVPILVTNSIRFANEVDRQLSFSLKALTRRLIAKRAIDRQGKIFVVDTLEDAARVANMIAPEHLELCVRNPRSILKMIKNAGAIFLGNISTEAFGDYIAGPSHVLPTGGAARFSSPLSVYDFLKMPSLISISKKGFDKLSSPVVGLAESEGLQAHAISVKVRRKC